jgi:hemoglobin
MRRHSAKKWTDLWMSDNVIPVTGNASRQPAHPSITPELISDLVEQFYARVQRDERLAPIFKKHVPGDWAPHLEIMKGFWRSVLLKTAEYGGRPVPVHVRIGGLVEDDFRTWLKLFRTTVDEIFEPDARPIVVEAAERIATSLWLATNGNLMARPPQWPD